jgi:hypothetical protein
MAGSLYKCSSSFTGITPNIPQRTLRRSVGQSARFTDQSAHPRRRRRSATAAYPRRSAYRIERANETSSHGQRSLVPGSSRLRPRQTDERAPSAHLRSPPARVRQLRPLGPRLGGIGPGGQIWGRWGPSRRAEPTDRAKDDRAIDAAATRRCALATDRTGLLVLSLCPAPAPSRVSCGAAIGGAAARASLAPSIWLRRALSVAR